MVHLFVIYYWLLGASFFGLVKSLHFSTPHLHIYVKQEINCRGKSGTMEGSKGFFHNTLKFEKFIIHMESLDSEKV